MAAGGLTTGAGADTATAWQSPDSIQQAAETYARTRLGLGSDADVETAGVDQRLRLQRCESALETRTHGAISGGRATVAVRCPGPSPWQIFVPVRVFRTIQVAVAARPIAAGELITANAVDVVRRSSAGLPHQYAEGLQAVVGQRARRAIAAGNVIQLTSLNVMKAVQRGSLVTLTTHRAGITVRGEGTALEEGAIGERIRLRTPAGRVVEGVVESDSEVRIGG